MQPKPLSRIWGRPLRYAHGKIWFFNKSGKCEIMPLDEFRQVYKNRLKYLHYTVHSNFFLDIRAYYFFDIEFHEYALPDMGHFNQSIQMAACKLQADDSLDTFFQYIQDMHKYNNERYKRVKETGHYHPRPEGLDRFVTKIDNPTFIRVPENTSKQTFDIIKIFVNTCTEWESNREEYLRSHLNDIYNMVLDKLANSRSYQKYEVPVGCLALTSIADMGDCSYQFTFELKRKLRDMKPV